MRPQTQLFHEQVSHPESNTKTPDKTSTGMELKEQVTSLGQVSTPISSKPSVIECSKHTSPMYPSMMSLFGGASWLQIGQCHTFASSKPKSNNQINKKKEVERDTRVKK
jgi:hypothetical protein